MAWCLPKYIANDFLERLKRGEINPAELLNMTSAERRAYFKDIFGEENVSEVNRHFESKMLLKNQQRGLINWAKQMSGISPVTKKDLLARIEKMSDILTPETEKGFLEDLVGYKLKTSVTMEEAGRIAELSRVATEKKDVMDANPRREKFAKPTDAEMDYGLARMEFEKYIDTLKEGTLGEQLREQFRLKNKLGIPYVSGLLKSLWATLDNSALGRQGWKTVFSHPAIWKRNALKSFVDIGRTLKSKNAGTVRDLVMADVYSRPNYENYLKDKVAVGITEEQFPQSGLLEKIPVAGRIHLAAENAFTNFQYRMRMDLYDHTYDLMKRSGIADPTGRGLGKYVNSLTSRGNLGKLEGSADTFNKLFFSPRKLKSDWDFLTAHLGQDIDPYLKKKAALNLLKTVTGTAGILTLANLVSPNSINLNPTNSDFGQVKVGNTRFDVTGGMKGLVVLASRLMNVASKNLTGKYFLPQEAYTGREEDMIYDFLGSKMSPGLSVANDILVKGKDFNGKPIDWSYTYENLLAPLPIQNILEAGNDDKSANKIMIVIADGLGITANTYKTSKLKKKKQHTWF